MLNADVRHAINGLAGRVPARHPPVLMRAQDWHAQVERMKRERAKGRVDGGADTGVMQNLIIRGGAQPCGYCRGTGRIGVLPPVADMAAALVEASKEQ